MALNRGGYYQKTARVADKLRGVQGRVQGIKDQHPRLTDLTPKRDPQLGSKVLKSTYMADRQAFGPRLTDTQKRAAMATPKGQAAKSRMVATPRGAALGAKVDRARAIEKLRAR